MKIYNKVVIDMTTMQIVHENSYAYCGKLALCCGGGGSVSYPGPSPQEIELLDMQLDYLKKMGEDAEQLRPYLLSSMGMKEVGGEVIKMTNEEYYESLGELDQKGYDVAMAAAERSLKAYAGELEISPALEKSLGQRKTELEENLSRNLGPGWQSTTSGIQAMAQFDETSNLIREEVRSGIITNEGGMTLSSLNYMSGISDTSVAAFPGQQSGGLFGAAGGMASQYGQERYHKFQADAASAQARSQRSAGLMSGFGQLAGAGMMAGATAYASSRKLKCNIAPIKYALEKLEAIRGVGFDWKDIVSNKLNKRDGHDAGVIAEEVEVVIPEAVTIIDGYKHVYYHKIIPLLIEAIKEQQIQIDNLKKE